MDDRELLDLAATDDGAALRLAVSLGLEIRYGQWPSGERYVAAHRIWHPSDSMYYDDGVALGQDRAAAARCAIIRAATARIAR